MKNAIEIASLPAAKDPVTVTDLGRVAVPAAKTPAEVADDGKVRVGGGMRLPSRQA